MKKYLIILVSLILTSLAQATPREENILDTFKEGLYGTNSYYCGRSVLIDRKNNMIYLELGPNPIHETECDDIGLPTSAALCPDKSGQNCKIKNNSKLDILSDSIFVLTHSNGEKVIYRWVNH